MNDSTVDPGSQKSGSDEAASTAPGTRPDSSQSVLARFAYRVVTSNLWLRTAIMTAVSVGLIVLSFHEAVTTKPTIPAYIAAQLGIGLLIVAVGAAVVQGFILSSPKGLNDLLDKLGSGVHSAWEAEVDTRLASLQESVANTAIAVSDQISQLGAYFGAQTALNEAGLLNIYSTWDESVPDMLAALRDRSVSDIRLLGLTLDNWFGTHRTHSLDQPGAVLERLLLGQEHASPNKGGISVRVLLADPQCAGAHLLMHGSGEHDSTEGLTRLANDALATAHHLIAFAQRLHAQGTGNSLEVRFYRATPGVSAFSTNLKSFVRSYFANRTLHEFAAPLGQYGGGSVVHDAVRDHFDIIWETSSIACDEILTESSYGVDQGIAESGIHNVYSEHDKARARMNYLLNHTRHRLWIQGISLNPMFIPPLESAMYRVFASPEIDVQLLVIDPNCEQAYMKSYRDYLLTNQRRQHLSFKDYLAQPSLHTNSLIYQNIKHSTERVLNVIHESGASHCQLRYYTCAPTSFVLIADDSALVEQYHYGKSPQTMHSWNAQLQLTEEMPLIEYRRPRSGLFKAQSGRNPFAVVENHFQHVFDDFSEQP